MKTRILYIERKEGGLVGKARIGRVRFSKTGATLYYGGHVFQSLKGNGFKANYYDIQTGEHFWISGPKKQGSNHLYGKTGATWVDADVREEFWSLIRSEPHRKAETHV